MTTGVVTPDADTFQALARTHRVVPVTRRLLADGETPEEAIESGRDALKSCLLTMREFGDPIPQPGSSTAPSGQWRQRVPKSLHARLTARAQREGVSLNMLVTTLIAEGLGKERARIRPQGPRR